MRHWARRSVFVDSTSHIPRRYVVIDELAGQAEIQPHPAEIQLAGGLRFRVSQRTIYPFSGQPMRSLQEMKQPLVPVRREQWGATEDLRLTPKVLVFSLQLGLATGRGGPRYVHVTHTEVDMDRLCHRLRAEHPRHSSDHANRPAGTRGGPLGWGAAVRSPRVDHPADHPSCWSLSRPSHQLHPLRMLGWWRGKGLICVHLPMGGLSLVGTTSNQSHFDKLQAQGSNSEGYPF